MYRADIDRNDLIVNLFKSGVNGEELADRFGVSHQRIYQILNRAGYRKTDGGMSVSLALRPKVKKHSKYNKNYGCTIAQARDISSRKDRIDYKMQRLNARKRGIPWEFSLVTWLLKWDESGKRERRGRKTGNFVMARHGDVGPYSPSNTKIITCNENCSEGRRKRK